MRVGETTLKTLQQQFPRHIVLRERGGNRPVVSDTLYMLEDQRLSLLCGSGSLRKPEGLPLPLQRIWRERRLRGPSTVELTTLLINWWYQQGCPVQLPQFYKKDETWYPIMWFGDKVPHSAKRHPDLEIRFFCTAWLWFIGGERERGLDTLSPEDFSTKDAEMTGIRDWCRETKVVLWR